MRQCCPPSIFTSFSQGSILESLVKKIFELTKLFNICWNRVLFILYLGSHFQQKLNNFANSDFFFTKLSRIDPCEKRVNILGGQHWRNSLMACSNLVTMAVYVVKQAWCNEIMPTVYIVSSNIIFLGILITEIRHKVLLLLNDRDRICWTWLTTRGRGWVWKYRPTLYGVTTITVREIMQWKMKNPLFRDKFKGFMKKVMV